MQDNEAGHRDATPDEGVHHARAPKVVTRHATASDEAALGYHSTDGQGLAIIFFRIHHHYQSVKARLAAENADIEGYFANPPRKLMLLAINDLNRHTLPALRDLLQTSGPNIGRQAVHVEVDEHASAALQCRWQEQHFEEHGVPLVVLPSSFGGGDVVGDLVSYVRGVLSADPDLRVEILIPEWSTSGVWWRWLAARMLHHVTGSRLKMAFLAQNRVTVSNTRYVLAGVTAAMPAAAESAKDEHH